MAGISQATLLKYAVSLALLLGGCSPVPMRNGTYSDGVTVTRHPSRWSEPRAPGSRSYGPRMGLEAANACLSSFHQDRVLFEVSNDRATPVGWVVWNYRYRVHARTPSPYGTDGPVWHGEGWERYGYTGVLPPGGSVMCSISLGLLGSEWASGGDILGCLAGSGWGRPRVALIATKYTGPEWLAPYGRFAGEHLQEALKRLRAAGARTSEVDLRTLLSASCSVNHDLPVVSQPEIVVFFVEQVLKAKPRETAADELLPPTLDGPEFALMVLLDMVPPAELRKHADALGALAAHAGDRRVVELLIKAGSTKALAELAGQPGRLPREGREDLVLAVQAASSDAKAFEMLLERFRAEKAVPHKVALARLLGLVGREEGLKALAGELRNSASHRDQKGHAWSVKGEVTDALRLVLPEEKALYTSVVPTRDQMAKVEEFCSKRFGVQFDGPLPEDAEVRGFRDGLAMPPEAAEPSTAQ